MGRDTSHQTRLPKASSSLDLTQEPGNEGPAAGALAEKVEKMENLGVQEDILPLTMEKEEQNTKGLWRSQLCGRAGKPAEGKAKQFGV